MSSIAKLLQIPEVGISPDLILKQLELRKTNDASFREGKLFNLVYFLDETHENFLKSAYTTFMNENMLNPMAFTSLRNLEHEIVRMSADLLSGGEKAVGSVTTGGTESILLAVKTYRDLARELSGVTSPEMIVPESAHVAFEKASEYFGVRLITLKMDKDKKADVSRLQGLINSKTVMIVASAPNYPFGVVDPIVEMGKIAAQANIPMHVDACVGGFFIPWVERLGIPVELFDFRVEGVTSISADLHKYGYTAKGASILLYRNMKFFRRQFFISTNWVGGVYASPNIPGTRPGGSVAAAWATLAKIGVKGYLEITKQILETKKSLCDGIGSIPELYVVGNPKLSLFAIASESLDIYLIADLLAKKGWIFDRQSEPPSIHITVMPNHQNQVEEFLSDLKKAVINSRSLKSAGVQGSAPLYGMIATLPARGLIRAGIQRMVENMYGPEGKMPDLAPEDNFSGKIRNTLLMRLNMLIKALKKITVFLRPKFCKLFPDLLQTFIKKN